MYRIYTFSFADCYHNQKHESEISLIKISMKLRRIKYLYNLCGIINAYPQNNVFIRNTVT